MFFRKKKENQTLEAVISGEGSVSNDLDKKIFKDSDFQEKNINSNKKGFSKSFSSSIKKFNYKRFVYITTILVCFVLVFSSLLLFSSLNKVSGVFGGGNLFSDIWDITKTSITGSRAEIKGEKEGRTNVLVLGKADEGGTDTMMILSYYYKENKMVALTIPRDLYVRDGYYDKNSKWVNTWDKKLNGVYVFAEQRKLAGVSQTEPAQAVADLITREYSVPLHYWLVINFNGVKDGIDLFGGVEVEVERSFSDCSYPNNNYGYLPCQYFTEGAEVMNGERALIYSRSRMGSNGEGSDFARSKRQTNVIKALLNKVKEDISNKKGLTVSNINGYLEVFGNNVKTSLTVPEILSFYQVFKESQEDNQNQESFYRLTWEASSKFLKEYTHDTAGYIITYKDGNMPMSKNEYSKSWAEAKYQVDNLLEMAMYYETLNSSIVILANGSSLTEKVYQEILAAGFERVWKPNYVYPNIKKSTSSDQETITFYIQEDKIRDRFSELAEKHFSFEFQVKKDFPEGLKIDANNAEAGIVAWIE